MKRILLVFLALVAMTSLVFAVGNGLQAGADVQVTSGSGAQVNTELVAQNQGGETQLQNQVQVQARAGNYTNSDGNQIKIKSEIGNNLRIQTGNREAKVSLNMTQNQSQNKTRLMVHMSNGMNSEVKIMPNVASETALAKLGAKCEENNCTIELKEVGTGNQTRAAYEINTQKEARVLGLFRANMMVQAHVNAETGEIIQTKKPWWAFIAIE
jgi:hypothetical protein